MLAAAQELMASYDKQAGIIRTIMQRSVAYCAGVPPADPDAVAANARCVNQV